MQKTCSPCVIQEVEGSRCFNIPFKGMSPLRSLSLLRTHHLIFPTFHSHSLTTKFSWFRPRMSFLEPHALRDKAFQRWLSYRGCYNWLAVKRRSWLNVGHWGCDIQGHISISGASLFFLLLSCHGVSSLSSTMPFSHAFLSWSQQTMIRKCDPK